MIKMEIKSEQIEEVLELKCPECDGTEFYSHYEYENIETRIKKYNIIDSTSGTWICVVCQEEVDDELQDQLDKLKGEIQ